tara:strand:- start:151 stop:399 length:249 start_codon:yes stop_codon:yes gene_type:complete
MKLIDLTAEQRLTYVGLLTIEQKDSIVGQIYATDSYFNPIQDINNDWIISIEEMEQCVNELYMWVKDLPMIEYIPKPEIEEI